MPAYTVQREEENAINATGARLALSLYPVMALINTRLPLELYTCQITCHFDYL